MVWLNGKPLDANARSLNLTKGSNPLLLRYDTIGRGWFLPRSGDELAEKPENAMPWNTELATRWYQDQGRLTLDTRSQNTRPAGWYRFTAPPGLRSLTIPCAGEIQVWADGRKLTAKMTNGEWNATLPAPARLPVVVAIRVEQVRGEYGGAAFRDFIRLDCGAGEIAPGDWSQAGVLETYSGAAWYQKSFPLTAPDTTGKVILDLGNVVASAELRVNGKPAGTKSAPPWTFDITAFVKSGENQIEVLVSNTLANHYVTIPTHYRGKTTSGLIGPVSIKLFR